MTIAPTPPGFPRRSTTIPLQSLTRSIARSSSGTSAGNQILKPITPTHDAPAPAGVSSRCTTTLPASGGRFPNCDTVPVAGTATSCRSTIFPPTLSTRAFTVTPGDGDSARLKLKSTSDRARGRTATGESFDLSKGRADVRDCRLLAIVCPGVIPLIAAGLPGSTRHTTPLSSTLARK